MILAYVCPFHVCDYTCVDVAIDLDIQMHMARHKDTIDTIAEIHEHMCTCTHAPRQNCSNTLAQVHMYTCTMHMIMHSHMHMHACNNLAQFSAAAHPILKLFSA